MGPSVVWANGSHHPVDLNWRFLRSLLFFILVQCQFWLQTAFPSSHIRTLELQHRLRDSSSLQAQELKEVENSYRFDFPSAHKRRGSAHIKIPFSPRFSEPSQWPLTLGKSSCCLTSSIPSCSTPSGPERVSPVAYPIFCGCFSFSRIWTVLELFFSHQLYFNHNSENVFKMRIVTWVLC